MRALVTPEQCCAYLSMQAAEQRLKVGLATVNISVSVTVSSLSIELILFLNLLVIMILLVFSSGRSNEFEHRV